MVVIPDKFSYAEVYLSLRCNFKCSYCVNAFSSINRKRHELSAREWCLALNNVDSSRIPLTIGGGEPTIHKDFYAIINGLHESKKIDLLTNGTFDVDEFMANIPASRFTVGANSEYKAIRISYHIGQTNEEKTVALASKLQEGGYSAGIFGLNHPKNLPYNVRMTELCRKSGIYFFVRDFLGYYRDHLYGTFRYPGGLNGNLKNCQCKTEELLVGPDASCYRCHRDLYTQDGAIGNLLNMAFQIEDTFRPCSNFGNCNPCDLKRKLSPDLITEKASVEIIYEED